MSGIGHNNGPSMASGAGWRRYAWGRARRELLPKLPIEVVRMRLRRARELGLDYKAYASVRAASGRDIVALLFSSNALRLAPRAIRLPEESAGKLARVKGAERLILVHPPADPEAVIRANAGLEAGARAPGLGHSWSGMRRQIAGLTGSRNLPADAVLVIGCHALEEEWAAAGRLAGFVPESAWMAEPARGTGLPGA